jgi:hypothetical protein
LLLAHRSVVDVVLTHHTHTHTRHTHDTHTTHTTHDTGKMVSRRT